MMSVSLFACQFQRVPLTASCVLRISDMNSANIAYGAFSVAHAILFVYFAHSLIIHRSLFIDPRQATKKSAKPKLSTAHSKHDTVSQFSQTDITDETPVTSATKSPSLLPLISANKKKGQRIEHRAITL